jgi:hypothetical protein
MALLREPGYDQFRVGPEEVRARQLLLDMMELLSSDPYAAMGLIPSATASDIRSAFLARTKQFHPARFGRMAPDIQRLANEVFLSLRAVHESLAKPAVKTPRTSGPMPNLGPRPIGSGASSAMRPTTGAIPVQPARPPSGQAPSLRPPTGPSPSVGGRPGTQPFRALDQAATQPLATRSPAAPPAAQPMPRSTVGARAAGPPGSGPRPQPVVGAPGERELAPIYELFAQQQLAAAKVALETLVARTPQSTKYKALLSYAKGRAAQLDKRVDEARVELHEALTLDPDLQLAKTALAELFTRRR